MIQEKEKTTLSSDHQTKEKLNINKLQIVSKDVVEVYTALRDVFCYYCSYFKIISFIRRILFSI